MKGTLAITGNAEADKLLNSDPFALLIGMLLDQQFPMERAFLGPYVLKERLGGELDVQTVAAHDPESFAALFKGPPAVHQYWGSMAGRVQALARHLLDEYDGDAAAVWVTATDAADLFKRLRALPGYGEQKSKIFIALLAKRFGVRPEGWEQVIGDYADDIPRSAADVDSLAALERVRATKKAKKAESKGKAG
jgi:uncharacterized HhH-GPD family protein